MLEERALALIESLPLAVFVCDRNATLQHYNKRAVELWGREPVCGIEKHCGSSKLYLPDGTWLPHEQSPIIEVLRTGEGASNVELTIERPDGSRVAVLLHFAALKSAVGEIVGAVTSFDDVTERKKAAVALSESEARKRAILESSLDAIICIDHTGRVLEFDQAAESTFGFASAEAVGREIADLIIPPALREQHRRGLAHYLATGEGPVLGRRIETTAVRADGSEFPVELSISRVGTQSPPTFTGFVRDVTERKRAEDEIRKLNAELESRVRERTAQLEAMNRELESFSYSVSHDLRAPLRHIAGFVNLLEESAGEALPQRSRRFLGVIADSARRMGQLIDDLLLFSRMNRAHLNIAPVNLAMLVEETIQLLEHDTTGRNIAWQHHSLPTVPGDRVMLRQVFVNLIGNAIKYTRPRDRAEIEIGAACDMPREVVVYVRDNGVGFDMEYADKLFGVFQRLHRDDEFEGTGIGLASVRRIVARHGGRTWAEGKVDGGAVFYFSLPR
jgi:PAS domain S-box-containing protein